MINKTYLIILAVFSICINQYFGNRGVFPIDSFLIFDSAYNVASGNHPFKDYWIITGPFLDYIQSLFFITFGVNWISYVLHASLLNMGLALFSFYFFLNIGLRNFYAFIYSLGVATLAYPPIGVPFIDHHSVIFCVMALYSLSLGILFEKKLFWFLTPIFLIFSFFSKQIPSSYLAILFVIIISIYFFSEKNKKNKNLLYLLLGSLFSIFLIVSVFFVNEIPVKNFFVQYISYPASLGAERIDTLNIDFENLFGQFKFIYFALIPLLFCIFILIRNNKKNFIHSKELVVSLLFLASMGIFMYCQLLTKNQVLIFFLIPISAAFSHAYITKFFNRKYLIYFILVIFFFSSGKYHVRFNSNKKFMELANADFNSAIHAVQLDERLFGLKWITPSYIDNPSDEINLLIDAKNILLGVKERKIIITDYQFFSSLLLNKIASPNKWYDELSVPNRKNKYYNNYKDFFLNKIKHDEVKYIYFIGKDKHQMNFFQELIYENKCMVSRQINELLIEFDINKCEQIL